MDKSREDFEAWTFESSPAACLAKKDGRYIYGLHQFKWEAWQASRKALVVELPPVCDCHSDDKDKGYDICHYAVQLKLEEQGLNFKVEGAERWAGITVKGEGDE